MLRVGSLFGSVELRLYPRTLLMLLVRLLRLWIALKLLILRFLMQLIRLVLLILRRLLVFLMSARHRLRLRKLKRIRLPSVLVASCVSVRVRLRVSGRRPIMATLRPTLRMRNCVNLMGLNDLGVIVWLLTPNLYIWKWWSTWKTSLLLLCNA